MSLQLKKAAKAASRLHRERSQPSERAHLGLLEKKKDYKIRATDYQAKQKVLKNLRKKALDRNPDEFYFHMINSKTMDGVHHEKKKEEEHTSDQIKLMHSQDLRYISFKRLAEARKIDRLKAVLNFLDAEGKPKNKHTFFVDTVEEAKSFDVVKELDTHPDLIDRSYNRLRIKDLDKLNSISALDASTLQKLQAKRQRAYRELEKRIEREKQLRIVELKLEAKRNLLDKKCEPPKEIKPATKQSAPVYLWKKERKR